MQKPEEYAKEPLSKEEKEWWEADLKRFQDIIYPTIFEPAGISYGTALMVWKLDQIKDAMYDIAENENV